MRESVDTKVDRALGMLVARRWVRSATSRGLRVSDKAYRVLLEIASRFDSNTCESRLALKDLAELCQASESDAQSALQELLTHESPPIQQHLRGSQGTGYSFSDSALTPDELHDMRVAVATTGAPPGPTEPGAPSRLSDDHAQWIREHGKRILGLTSRQVEVLVFALSAPYFRKIEAAAALGLTRQGVGVALERLSQRGLVTLSSKKGNWLVAEPGPNLALVVRKPVKAAAATAPQATPAPSAPAVEPDHPHQGASASEDQRARERPCLEHLQAALALMKDDETATVLIDASRQITLSIGKYSEYVEVSVRTPSPTGWKTAYAIASPADVGTIILDNHKKQAQMRLSEKGLQACFTSTRRILFETW